MKKSPLRYPGGKSRGVKFLKEFIPEFSEFREPFFGGGSLSFYLIQVYKNKRFEASDLNYELYCFWSQLKTNSKIFIESLQNLYDDYKINQQHNNGKELFNLIISRRNDDLSELQRAVDFFILNRITFSGVVDSGGFSQGSFEGRFTQSSIDRLTDISTLISNVQFYCEDYSYLVNQYGEDVFIFLDPPYYSATKSKLYGKKGILHTEFNHEELFSVLKNSKHKWLITYDNSDYIKNLYKDFYQLEWTLQYGMTNSLSSTGNELLIANYDLNKVHSLKKTNKNELIQFPEL
jgi:DNA adenine methylase